MPDGNAVEAVTLGNDHGVTVRVITYGARLQEVVTPDRNGSPANIALGFSSLDGYLSNADPRSHKIDRSDFGRREASARGSRHMDGAAQ
jgi:hypothetical protein